MPILEGIVAGAIGGLGWSLVGLAKEKTGEKPEDFDYKKTVKTVILGVAVGGYMGYSGLAVDFDAISVMASSVTFAPVVAVVDKLAGIIWNIIGKAKK